MHDFIVDHTSAGIRYYAEKPGSTRLPALPELPLKEAIMNLANARVNDAVDPNCISATPAIARKPRKVPTLPIVWCCSAEDAVDTVLAQHPTSAKRPEYYPGKRFALAADGTVDKPAFNLSSWFRSVSYAVSGIDSLHVALERVRTGADTNGLAAYVVHGDLAPWASPASAPRSKTFKKRADGKVSPKGLQDAKRRWIILDLDYVANVLGIDPRVGVEARLSAIEFLRSLLPAEMSEVRCSWQISNSCCVRGTDGKPLATGVPPDVLGAHLRYWLSAGLDEPGRKAILNRLKAHARSRLAEMGVDAGKAGVDSQVAVYNQASFLRPSFENGLADPLPERSGLVKEGRDQVDLDVLDGQLAPAATPRARVRRESTPEDKAARSERRRHDTLLRAANRQSAAPAKAAPKKTTSLEIPGVRRRRPRVNSHLEARLRLSRENKLEDITTLVMDRKERLPEWSQGVPQGRRRTVMLIVAGLCAQVFTLGTVRDAIDSYGVLLTSREWLESEFHATRQDAGILRRAEAAEADEEAGVVGSRTREDPWLGRIMEALQPTHDEMIRLRLRALRTNAARMELARRDAGKPTAEQAQAIRKSNSEKSTRPWEALGISQATYGRRKCEARQQAAEAALNPKTAMLTEQGLQDVLDFISLVAAQDQGAMERLVDGPLGALRHENLDAVPDGYTLPLYLAYRAERIHSDRLAWVANLLTGFERLRRHDADTSTILNFVLYDGANYLRHAHETDTGDRIHRVADLIRAVEAEPSVYRFLEKRTASGSLPKCSETFEFRRVQVTGMMSVGVLRGQRQVILYPGQVLAGCSKAAWYRRAARANVDTKPAYAAPTVLPEVTTAPEQVKRALW